MKKRIITFIFVLCACMLVGCGDDDGLSWDEEQLAKVRAYIAEGDFESAEDECRILDFSEEYYYYVGYSELCLAKEAYGAAACTLNEGMQDFRVEDNADQVADLQARLDEVIAAHGDVIQKTREKERELYVAWKAELDVLQDQIDAELEEFYDGHSSKVKLVLLAKELNYDINGISQEKCDGDTAEYDAVSTYHDKVKKQIKYMKKYGEEDEDDENGNFNKEKDMLEAQADAQENRAAFEELVKSEPLLY